MKQLILIAFTLFNSVAFAQNEFPRVEGIITEEKIVHGNIDKYPVTIYLKFHRYSNNSTNIYSVSGWYYYDKVKTKIPLVGVWASGEMVLYNFKDSTRIDEVLDFQLSDFSNRFEMDSYTNLKGFQEKFQFLEEGSYWEMKEKRLDVSLDNSYNYILDENKYLYIDSTHVFHLQNLGNWRCDFKLLAHNKHSYILEYEYASQSYVQGRCGAGVERGFFLLKFENNMLSGFEEFPIESCNGNIYNDTTEVLEDGVTKFICNDYPNDKTYAVTIDKTKISVVKTNLQ